MSLDANSSIGQCHWFSVIGNVAQLMRMRVAPNINNQSLKPATRRDAYKQNIIPRARGCFVGCLFMQIAFARQQKPAATLTLCAAGSSQATLLPQLSYSL
jgi:hypothetical protein